MILTNVEWGYEVLAATRKIVRRYLDDKPLTPTERKFIAMMLLRVGSLPEGYKPIVRKEDESGADPSEAPPV
jgi:hypothetical protein